MMSSTKTTSILPPLSVLINEIKSALPETYARFNKRIYKNADRWHDVRFSTLSFASVVGILQDKPLVKTPLNFDSIAKMQAVLGSVLLQYEVPTFFVEKELLNACIQSKPPQQINWRELNFAFPAMIFMLPKKTVFFSDGSECQYIAFGRLAKGTYRISRINEIYNDKDMFVVFSESPSGFSLHHIAEGGENYQPATFEAEQHTRPQDLFSMEMNQSDHEVGLLLLKIAVNLLYAMQARPELREDGKRLGRHKKQPSEFWSPNVIGGKYRVQRKTVAAGTHNAPRMHWRSGHFREQACGERFSKRKTIWLEPILVGG